ncbi:MAG: hypothetical protein ABIG71_04575 [Candidatus Uhrbacteria bacterium]
MDHRASRIMIACSAGGALTLALLYALVPDLGIVAVALAVAGGSLVGYFGYNMAEVVRKAPTAWRQTQYDAALGQTDDALELCVDIAFAVLVRFPLSIIKPVARFLSKPRPVFFCTLFVGAAFGGSMMLNLMAEHPHQVGTYVVWPSFFVTFFCLGFLASALSFIPLVFMAVAIEYNHPVVPDTFFVRMRGYDIQHRDEENNGPLLRYSCSYHHAGMFLVYGTTSIVVHLFRGVAVILGGVAAMLGFCARFAVKLVRLVHSNERVICAIYAPVGGVATYAYVATVGTVAEYGAVAFAATIVAAGTISAILGLCGYTIARFVIHTLNGHANDVT